MIQRNLIRTACTILALSSGTSAWTSPATTLHRSSSVTTTLLSKPDANNPCWQDNYDSEDDCMSTVYSSAFVAEEWIKSMPCGKDADCLPEKLSRPGTMGGSGVEKVDVMEYLNIRKAAPVAEKIEKKGAAGP
mmetsp:Transcript_21014/g.37696  ORF Transcript_21014/g.37696 Transcript_21014/m.37696 type:complete len:133 (-) Transcript_21014:307-705(-)|eukprot:CAMPEP_0201599888 /NCGR_PEP_ID=MMETSP0492-20130828/1166_1 /ASSEMBLY_ACC=CAM_ASM_000837 /TAXON_ID=420259 /ORGANISM="Thalassiosira gravida, Strain GMp14c1" /LENGTH=132 /DNA_ID=CAMNT_0048062543 /DNA_START=184 /DNA_END=585 /DNA_ORIENTATION=-